MQLIPSVESLDHEHQQTLIGSLQTELALCETFVQSAALAHDSEHQKHFHESTRRAHRAAEAISRMLDKVSDHHVKAEMATRLEELRQSIATL